jgi:hypothetical protein
LKQEAQKLKQPKKKPLFRSWLLSFIVWPFWSSPPLAKLAHFALLATTLLMGKVCARSTLSKGDRMMMDSRLAAVMAGNCPSPSRPSSALSPIVTLKMIDPLCRPINCCQII